jgi:hypothetical protein
MLQSTRFPQPFEELFLPNLGICGFRTQWFSSGKYKNLLLYHAVVQLELLALAYWYTEIFSSLDNQYWRVPLFY